MVRYSNGHRTAVTRAEREDYFRDKQRKGYLTADQLPEASREAFDAANVKHDGRLSLQEEVNALLKDFDAADVDKDGTLTYEELEAYVKRSSR